MKVINFSTYLFQDRTIAVDIDGTLVIWDGENKGVQGSRFEINEILIEKLIKWKTVHRQNRLIIWTGAGESHLEFFKFFFKNQFPTFHKLVDEYTLKPTAIIDDTEDWFDGQSKMVNIDK